MNFPRLRTIMLLILTAGALHRKHAGSSSLARAAHRPHLAGSIVPPADRIKPDGRTISTGPRPTPTCGCVIQTSSIPSGRQSFSDLTHYVPHPATLSSASFATPGNAQQLAFAVGALSHTSAVRSATLTPSTSLSPSSSPKLRQNMAQCVNSPRASASTSNRVRLRHR